MGFFSALRQFAFAHKTAAWTMLVAVGVLIMTTATQETVKHFIGGLFSSGTKRAEAEARRLATLHVETVAVAQKIQIYAQARRKATGDSHLDFSEEELLDILLPQQTERLSAAITLLRKDGFAEESTPGNWRIC